ncbi:hypothetical protein GCM10011331_09970 [Flavimobilis marinus]|nr:hypothetical protein GCM10011331_09970 [Flavimobilis marinus]
MPTTSPGRAWPAASTSLPLMDAVVTALAIEVEVSVTAPVAVAGMLVAGASARAAARTSAAALRRVIHDPVDM